MAPRTSVVMGVHYFHSKYNGGKMNFIVKLLTSVVLIILATQIGKKIPSAAGLIATMPLTGLIVMMWLYFDNRGNHYVMEQYSKGAMWGILPSFMFFLTTLLCFKRNMTLPFVLVAGTGAWLIGAALHQWFLN